MRIIGVLLDVILQLDIETYKNHVVFGNGKKVM